MMDSKMWLKFRPRQEKYLAVEKELESSAWPNIENSMGPPPLNHSKIS